MNPHVRKQVGLGALASGLWENRGLVGQLARRDVSARYRGSLVGVAWMFINPLLMLGIYTFVFSVVFKARWGDSSLDHGSFAVVLFVGILVHGLFAECLNRAPGLVLENAGYVKRIVFPLEILPWVSLGTSLFHTATSFAVLLAAEWVVMGRIPWTVIFLPLVFLPLALATMGLSWAFAAVGVYVRDIGQMTSLLTTAMLFLSPVFYPISALPERYRFLFLMNPLTPIIELARDVAVWGHVPNWTMLTVSMLFAVVLAWIGFWAFQRMRPGFADVL